MKRSILRRPYPYTYVNVTLYLIIANILVFMAVNLLRRGQLVPYLALSPVGILGINAYWQFITYMFLHADFTHILFNMLGLFFFGISLERRMGSWEFLTFYMVSGVLAGVFSFFVYWLSGSYQVFLLGASGAVFAVLLAFATYFPDAMIYIFGIIPVKAPVLVIGYTAIELFSQFSGRASNVAHLTHLAGFGFAFLYLVIRLNINPIQVFRGGGRGGPWR